MKNILLAMGLAFLGSLSACAPKVNVEQRANVDFSSTLVKAMPFRARL